LEIIIDKVKIHMVKFFVSIYIGVMLISANVLAQTRKKFFNEKGKVITDSTKAVTYMLYQVGEDSIWSTVLLNMKNIPLQKAYFGDAELTVPVGKFVSYQTVIHQQKAGDDHSIIDTEVIKHVTGYFDNGLKEGVWTTYYANGNVMHKVMYEQDEKDGLYEQYYYDGRLSASGNYVKDMKEGEWYFFREDSTIIRNTTFYHDRIYDEKIYNTKDQITGASPGYNFIYYISKYLKKLGIPGAQGHVVVNFTVNENGILTKPTIAMGLNTVLDKAIIDAINTCPKWDAAKKNKQAIEQKMTLVFTYR
jgi:hypothetical protein